MKTRLIFAAVLALSTVWATGSRAAPEQAGAPIVAAERAFAAFAAEHGWITAFKNYAAPNGVIIANGKITNAHDYFDAQQSSGSKSLKWWPAVALIARSGDLGFTTGPYSIDDSGRIQGQYFTVWKLQPDGRWLWLFDGGSGTEEPVAIPRDGPVAEFEASAHRRSSERAALAAVARLEARHALAGSLAGLVARNARILRPGRPPATRDAAPREMVFPTPSISYLPAERAFASRSGDLVFTLGPARWPQESGTALSGHYARIWQITSSGWRIVFDELLPRPAASGS